MKKIIAKTAFFIVISLIMSSFAQAATIDQLSDGYNMRPINQPFALSNEDFNRNHGSYGAIIVLQILAGGLLYFAAPLATIFIVWGGVQVVIGGAESEKLEQAKKHLTWSILGLLLIIFSYSAVRAILEFVFIAGTPVA